MAYCSDQAARRGQEVLVNDRFGQGERGKHGDVYNGGPDAEGTVTGLERTPLLGLGEWLGVNGEAVCGARPWKVQAEGDIRYTAKGGYVYAYS